MHDHHLEVTRTARYHVLGDLASATDVWIALHGYAQLARFFARPFASIVTEHRAVVAPEALNRYYFETAPGVHSGDARVAATWMTKEDRAHEIGDYVAYLDRLADHILEQAPHARLTALGFSQGAQTLSRWGALGAAPLARIVLWGSGCAHDLALHAQLFRGADLVLAVGDEDPNVAHGRGAAELQRLRDGGLDPRVFEYRGGHRIDEASLRDLLTFL